MVERDLTPFIETLHSRISVSEVVRRYIRLTRRGNEYVALCPFHDEKSPSFTINDEKGFYHCFGCGVHGDIISFIGEKENLPFLETLDFLAKLIGLEVPKKHSISRIEPRFYEVLKAASRWFEEQLNLTSGSMARQYLKKRGLTESTITTFHLGYAPEKGLKEFLVQQGFPVNLQSEAGLVINTSNTKEPYDRFRNRVMFPIYDTKERVIAFGGRILGMGEPKYLNSPDILTFAKGNTLYALNQALKTGRREKSMIVVEGYMDVITLHQAGFISAVSPLGTALTPQQIELLWNYDSNPILCFDGDKAGYQAAERAAGRALSALKLEKSLSFCFLPQGEDPDSLIQNKGPAALKNILSHPKPLVDVIWNTFLEGRTLSTPEQKAAVKTRILQTIEAIPNSQVRHFYKQDFESRLYALFQPKFKGKTQQNQQSLPNGSGNLDIFNHRTFNQSVLGQKILLVTLINHPQIISEVAEQFASLKIITPDWDQLRKELVTLATQETELTSMQLIDYLQLHGFAPLLTELMSPTVYTHARFALPSASEEEALKGWRSVWEETQGRLRLKEDLEDATHLAKTTFTELSWERLKHLKGFSGTAKPGIK